MSKSDGGPAFPSPLEWRETRVGQGDEVMISGTYDNGHDGMSLRDYFAGKAMAAQAAGTIRKLAERAE
jgi:hypothetical protein